MTANTALPTTFEFTAPGREIIEQLNLRVPSEYAGARQAAISCFTAIWDPGSNSPTTLSLKVGPDKITVSVSQAEYVHGA